ncbi:tetratricopeptide repeat protein [Actinoplanes sp. NEAU-A12]|uniref:Tetratricopeptide repeat protein n=1 Tax=Actinoplanes sandaracinus TaxID=3045177 RepID=A0ABT6WCB2_9ACTN|nr:tetratricopeptide repeat protein [Actinoplanes sandaracinus]MDI6097370.1 tetratricopeptide repeat protein [Actinoplanes sandaracinus]
MDASRSAAGSDPAGDPEHQARDGSTTTAAQLVEVHRLAVAGREPEIARDVGHRAARVWLRTSRFADVAALARATLTLGPDAAALYDLGWAQSSTGRPWDALACYRQALDLYREACDRLYVAATLSNIGLVYDNLGDRQQALSYYQRAVPILREAGNRAGEATALNNIGAVYDHVGDRRQALTYYQQALPIRREVGDRPGEAVTLNNMGSAYDKLGDRQQALTYYQQALPIACEVGDRGGEAITLNNIGMVYDNLGDRQQALTYYHQALPTMREIGNRAGEAATLGNIGMVYNNLGDHQQALTHYHRALTTMREIGNRAGEATTLNNISVIRFRQGDLAGAKDALDEVLEILRATGDRGSEATARFNMALLSSRMARADEAVAFQRQAIALAERTRHPELDQMRAFLLQLEQMTKGQAMVTATVEVSGASSAHWAAELHATLAANIRPGENVSPVEVQRSAELVIAVIGLVFAGVDTAKTIWDWWHSRRPDGATVTILLSDGTRLDVADVSHAELEIIIQRALSQR